MDADGRFQRCASFVLAREGWDAYTNTPGDKGGPTRWGVTLATLSAYRGHACTVLDVQTLGEAEALAIYRNRYWAPIAGDSLPSGVDLIVFDAAINQGPGRAVKFLQRGVLVPQDGVIGPQTLNAVSAADASALIDDIANARMAAYTALPTWPEFGHGWTNRLNACSAQAHAWVGS